MADQRLVPKDRPYGARQETVQSMRRAGLALDPALPSTPAPTGGVPSPQPQARPTPPRFDPLLETTPSQFPTTAGGTPAIAAPTVTSAKDAFAAMAAKSSSGMMRTIALRMGQR